MAEDLCCGCPVLDTSDEYNLDLHIAAVFIIFLVSIIGTLVPSVSKKIPLLSANSIFIEWLMTFGFGVVIATAFIHMINEGISMLSHPCLGDVVENYESLGLAIVLAIVLLMHYIECECSVYIMKNSGSLQGGHTHSHPHGHVHGHGTMLDNTNTYHVATTPSSAESSESYEVTNEKAMASLRKKLAILIFEFGVVLHSVIIGVDLGVTAGDTSQALLAAICFHQFFEGIAFGCTVMISNVSSKKALATHLVYAVTTPLGLALGIAIRSTYSDTSITALWVQGISNCVAGGILLYTGLVELMTYQITTNSEFLGRSSKHRIALYIALWLGSGIMALIGKWA